ncbi:hypothetical protein [Leptospira sp. GIMC2001]|uniref:hypothetical protein n=1 Tax=Leptospira sp. GIMC2001 TaxID=1513297 RepID=UPI00234A07F6|nr:hypothetical protein [Leptospira sp. GIMC2001]WCL51488.1 hypothetical protein O4O04_19935 [Leptospira sp. GIMC2001]
MHKIETMKRVLRITSIRRIVPNFKITVDLERFEIRFQGMKDPLSDKEFYDHALPSIKKIIGENNISETFTEEVGWNWVVRLKDREADYLMI